MNPLAAVLAAVLALLSTGCAVKPPPAPPPPAPVATPPPPPAPPPPVCAPPLEPADRAARALLAAQERLRSLTPAELAQAGTQAAGEPPIDPLAQPGAALERALTLATTHQPGDVARAQALLDPILHSPDPGLAPWQPLARLLQARLAEQRRLEDTVERQAQQLREQQRRLDQLSSRLEALKAIERSLSARPRGSDAAGSAPPRSP